MGGQAPKAIRSVEYYDFATDTWTLVSSATASQQSPPTPPITSTAPTALLSTNGGVLATDLPSRRCRCGVAVVRGLIYVIGGFNGALRVRSVDIYDPVRRLWRAGPSMECRRSTLGVAVLDEIIYAVGGFNGVKGKCVANDSLKIAFLSLPNQTLVLRSHLP